MLAYLLLGWVLSVIGHWALQNELGRIVAVGVVAFAAAMMLRFGVFWYLVGYVLVFWYVLSPLFSATLGLGETIEGHVVGVLLLFVFWTSQRVWTNENPWQEAWPEGERLPIRIAAPYAGILSATMMIGMGVGGRILSTDQTILAQSSLNIISPSMEQTWQAGASRMVFGIGGAIVGFYIGQFFPSLIAFEIVIAVCSFVGLAFFRVNMGFLVGAFAVMFTYPTGALGEAGHASGNEKLLAEFLGILVAGIAISLIGRLLAESGQ